MVPSKPKTRHSALTQLVITRFREFWREPESIFWGYGFPLLMVVALGIAFRNKPIDKVAICLEGTNWVPKTVRSLMGSGKFQVSEGREDECHAYLRSGRTDVAITIEKGKYIYHYDPTRPESALARTTADDFLQRSAGRKEVLPVEDIKTPGRGGRYIDFLVPGLIALSILGGGLWGVGFAVVDLRIRKLLKRLAATPMKRSDFLLSVVLSRLIFLIPEVLFLLAFSWLAFDVIVYGNFLALGLLLLSGTLAFSGIGLLVGSRARTMETIMGLINLVSLPMWMLSGVFFSTDRFPAILQPFIKLLPLTPLVDGLRLVMQEGAGLMAVSSHIGTELAWAGAMFFLALRMFRWM